MKALCNDCLREVNVTPNGFRELICPECRGDACDCPSCMRVLKSLHRGNRDRAALHLKDGRPFTWSPDGGIVEK
jgi:hypothetical protein